MKRKKIIIFISTSIVMMAIAGSYFFNNFKSSSDTLDNKEQSGIENNFKSDKLSENEDYLKNDKVALENNLNEKELVSKEKKVEGVHVSKEIVKTNKPSISQEPSESVKPSIPSVPQVPSAPVKPNKPSVQQEPSAPVKPNIPSIPQEPNEPINPDIPSVPQEPSESVKPSIPSVPQVPSAPAKPNIPSVPQEPSAPVKPNKPSVPQEPSEPVKPNIPSIPQEPNEPINPDIPSTPELPSEPDIVLTDLNITKDDLVDGIITISNKIYNNIFIDSSLADSKIVLDNVEIKEKLILKDEAQYEVVINDSKIPYITVENNQIKREENRELNINKNINGPTLQLKNVKDIKNIDITGNASIYGDCNISNLHISNGMLLLDAPTKFMNIDKNSSYANITVNQIVNEISDSGNCTNIAINCNVDKVNSNGQNSNIYIKENITVDKINVNGNSTSIMGNGLLNAVEISGDNAKVYTKTPKENIIINESAKNVFVGREEKFKINSIIPKQQGVIEFTLNEATSKPLKLSDISILCNGGNSMTVFDIKTNDNKTYTLSTSYYRDNIYELYITLPNGNIISREFNYSYNHPTASKVEVNRTSKTNAILDLYDVDEGGYLYYKLVEKNNIRSKNNVLSKEDIKENGIKVSIKSNYNEILISDLKENTEYDLYYVMEGFDGRTSPVYGPLTVGLYNDETEVSEYKLDYLAEVEANKFVFTFNRPVEGELKLEDFKIICPSESTLTTKGAQFIVSPDKKTYTIIVPDNYGHKDNKYTVSVNMPDGTIVEGSFRSHFDPPVTSGESIERYAKDKMKFKFNSDEHGVLYYGIYDWNQSVFEGDSNTPMAEDVLSGKIKSQKAKLNSGYNELDIDLSGYTLTNKSRLWVLYVDYDNNYRVGFVDHYKIPEFTGGTDVEEEDKSKLDITNLEVSEYYGSTLLELYFNEDLTTTFGERNIKLQSLSGVNLPARIPMSVSFPSNESNYASIELRGLKLASGDYRITIETFDSKDKPVKIVKEFTVK